MVNFRFPTMTKLLSEGERITSLSAVLDISKVLIAVVFQQSTWLLETKGTDWANRTWNLSGSNGAKCELTLLSASTSSFQLSLLLSLHFSSPPPWETLVRNKLLKWSKSLVQDLLFHSGQVIVQGLASFFWRLWGRLQIHYFCFGLR